MNRLDAFWNLRDHPYYRDGYLKLSTHEFYDCEQFILDRWSLDRDQFAEAANRWRMDQPELRTKNHGLMVELLTVANGNAKAREPIDLREKVEKPTIAEDLQHKYNEAQMLVAGLKAALDITLQHSTCTCQLCNQTRTRFMRKGGK